MTLEGINTFLEVLALLNDGVNHGSEYRLYELANLSSVEKALDDYFSGIAVNGKSYSPSAWQISTDSLSTSWQVTLNDLCEKWFFNQEFSPHKPEEWSRRNVIRQFLEQVSTFMGEAQVYWVNVLPPTFYELVWDDLAFVTNKGYYLLHFGFSD
jgi:hypothetical protein